MKEQIEDNGDDKMTWDFEGDFIKWQAIPVEWNGHLNTTVGISFLGESNSVSMHKYLAHELSESFMNLDRRRALFLKNGKPQQIFLGCNFSPCGECGEPLEGWFDGEKVIIQSKSGEPCPHPLGMPAYSFEISIPSGKMVLANDLRNFFKDVEDPDVSVNKNVGCRAVSMAYAKVGMAHASVLNTCPHVYQHSPEKLTVAVSGYTDDDEVVPPGEDVGGICTDLWWYSMADAEELKRRGYDDADPVAIVRPGRYRFTHEFHLHENQENTQQPIIYATIEWVGEI